MTDFFREVDEELRNDRMRKVWKNYGRLIIAAAVLIVAATGAYRFYLHWSETQAAQSGDRYLKALQLLEDGDYTAAQSIFSKLEKDGSGAYPLLARLRAASALLGEGKTIDAIEAFDTIISEKSIPIDLRDYARLQASLAAVDVEGYDAISKRTKPLLADENPWRYLAREALALSAWKAGNLSEAAKWIQELKSTLEIPQQLRQRVQILEDLIISRGGSLPDTSDAG